MTPPSNTSHAQPRNGFLSLAFLRDLLLVLLIVVVGWKLIESDVSFDLTSFSFTDFLALVLSLFSVALSVAFYFKANDASNKFYDNTYKFTKEMSEILGRIEAGFGERLRNLDEGYSGVRAHLDKFPYYSVTPSDVKNEEEKIVQKEAEQRAMIEELAHKAQLAEDEKVALFSNLAQKNEELENARALLREMQENSSDSKKNTNKERTNVARYVAEILKNASPTMVNNYNPDISAINKLFSQHRDSIANSAMDDMIRLGLAEKNGNLTVPGMITLRSHLTQL